MVQILGKKYKQGNNNTGSMKEKGEMPLWVWRRGIDIDPHYWEGKKGNERATKWFKDNPDWAYGGSIWTEYKIQETLKEQVSAEVKFEDSNVAEKQ